MRMYVKILSETIKKNKLLAGWCVAIIMLMSILQVLIPLYMKDILAEIESQGTVAMLCKCVIIYAILWLIYTVINVHWYKQIDILGEKVLWLIREKIYDVVFDCNQGNKLNKGRDYLKNVVFTDVISIYGNIILYSLNMFADLVVIITFIAVSFVIDVRTTILLLSAVVGGLGLSAVLKPMMAECSKRVNKALKHDNEINNECIDAIDFVKTNGLQKYYKARVKQGIHDFISEAVKSDQKLVFAQNIVNSYHQIILMLITAFLFLNEETANSGNIVYYIFVANLIIDKSQNIESNFYKFLRNIAAFDNVKDFYDTEKKDALEGLDSISTIEIQNLYMSYEERGQVLKGLSFSAKKGDAILIKGGNGSGKTTLLKLIAGLIEPQKGEIFFDTKSSENVDKNLLYKNICYLSQDEIVLNEDLAEYLSIIAHKEITKEHYEKCVERVGLTKEFRNIFENGRNLSGGEKKKILLMKLLTRLEDVSVILLDEVEAGLDKDSQRVLEEIEEEILSRKDKYIIFRITHGNVKHETKYNRVINLT